jgi:hypothetical protein
MQEGCLEEVFMEVNGQGRTFVFSKFWSQLLGKVAPNLQISKNHATRVNHKDGLLLSDIVGVGTSVPRLTVI